MKCRLRSEIHQNASDITGVVAGAWNVKRRKSYAYLHMPRGLFGNGCKEDKCPVWACMPSPLRVAAVLVEAVQAFLQMVVAPIVPHTFTVPFRIRS